MRNDAWNHNIQYHDVLLNSIPANCGSALDVGCGRGLVVSKLARRCTNVIGIDLDASALEKAAAEYSTDKHVRFVQGNVMTYPFSSQSFDFIAAVATLHHLPLRPALERFCSLLKPGGILGIVGLYRAQTLKDHALSLIALPASRIMRLMHSHDDVGAPLQNPSESLSDIRITCRELLPGAVFKTRLLFRYSVIWRKP